MPAPVLHQVREPIGPQETAADLILRLSEMGAEALVEALALYEAGLVEEREQEEAGATYAPRILAGHGAGGLERHAPRRWSVTSAPWTPCRGRGPSWTGGG